MLKRYPLIIALLLLLQSFPGQSDGGTLTGLDNFFSDGHAAKLKGKKIALYTNHTGLNNQLQSTVDLFAENTDWYLTTIFTPEHGLKGSAYANEKIHPQKKRGQITIHSLFGDTERPTKAMLTDIDIIIVDIQDIGVRPYTYTTTLFYIMEEAAKFNLPVIVLDRPNPISGNTVDGPMLNSQQRSRFGYVDVPYCHGMTIGELALYFNAAYNIKTNLEVIPMKGWYRDMTFSDTGLPWMPTSPHIPDINTPIYTASTGLIGELGMVSIGVGYTLPFRIIGAPWINGIAFAKSLNNQQLPGVIFYPFFFRPFYGLSKGVDCEGVLIMITDSKKYQPFSTQYLLMDRIKQLYPEKFQATLSALSTSKQQQFNQIAGNTQILNILQSDKKAVFESLLALDKNRRSTFINNREKYLIPDYSR